MLGIVSMAGNALKAFGNTHPAVKWGVIVLAFLLAAEFVAKEGVAVWVQLETARATVEKQNADANSAIGESCAKATHFVDPSDPKAAEIIAYDKMRRLPSIRSV